LQSFAKKVQGILGIKNACDDFKVFMVQNHDLKELMTANLLVGFCGFPFYNKLATTNTIINFCGLAYN
jgi:hypothetical protein